MTSRTSSANDENPSFAKNTNGATVRSKWWMSGNNSIQPDNEEAGNPASNSKPRRGKKWRSTATEELVAFRPVPVVGRLPWRVQHIAATIGLVVSLLLLLFVAAAAVSQLRRHAAASEDASVGVLVQAMSAPLTGVTSPSKGAVDAAMRRVSSLNIAGTQSPLLQVKQALSQSASIDQMRPAAEVASKHLNSAIVALSPQWRQAGSTGEWSSPNAVNFAQALAEFRYLADTSSAITSGDIRPLDDRFSAARQNIEQALRTVAQTPTPPGPLLEAWRSLARGWTAASPSMDIMLGQRVAWNEAVLGQRAALGLQSSVLSSSGRLSEIQTQDPSWISHAPSAIALTSSLVGLALCFLTWVGWKQQRWQSLNEMASNEQIMIAIDKMAGQVRRYRLGSQAKFSSPHPLLDPLVEAVLSSLGQTRTSHSDLLTKMKTLVRDSIASADATGVLIDLSRKGPDGVFDSGQDILAVTRAIQEIHHEARTALTLVGDGLLQDDSGAAGLAGAVESLGKIESRTKEQATRFDRLTVDARQVLDASRGVGDDADRLAVLSIQAAIQAARAGEAGLGFRVIADHLKELSERLASSARRAGAGAESLVSDLMVAATSEVEILSDATTAQKFQEVAQEWLLSQDQKSDALRSGLGQVVKHADAQNDIVNRLAERTSSEISHFDEFVQAGQRAAETAAILSGTASSLDSQLSAP